MDATRRTLLCAFVVSAVTSASGGQAPHGAKGACPSDLATPGTAPSGVLAIAVDRTSLRSPLFVEQVLAAVSAAMRPGMRVVIGRFGGAAAPLPEIVKSTVLPAPAVQRGGRDRGLQVHLQRAVQLITLPADADEAAARCELEAFTARKKELLAVLARELKVHDSSRAGFSPIVLSVGTLVGPYVPVRAGVQLELLLLTDAVEHARAMTLEPGVQQRALGIPELVERSRRLYPGDWTGAMIHVAGIGHGSSPDPAFVARLMEVWKAIIESRGATAVEITTSAPQLLGWHGGVGRSP